MTRSEEEEEEKKMLQGKVGIQPQVVGYHARRLTDIPFLPLSHFFLVFINMHKPNSFFFKNNNKWNQLSLPAHLAYFSFIHSLFYRRPCLAVVVGF